MKNKTQEEQKEENILITVKNFLQSPCSMLELSKRTGFTKSSVQRYLNDKTIIDLLGESTYLNIQNILFQRHQEALSKGGKTSTDNYKYNRDDNGHFSGIVR